VKKTYHKPVITKRQQLSKVTAVCPPSFCPVST